MYGFEGWLLKINGVEFPTKYIRVDTYKVTPDQKTDVDDYTDNDGVFHRNILPARATKIEFNIMPIYQVGLNEVLEILPVQLIAAPLEIKLSVVYHIFFFACTLNIRFRHPVLHKKVKSCILQYLIKFCTFSLTIIKPPQSTYNILLYLIDNKSAVSRGRLLMYIESINKNTQEATQNV